MTIDDRAFARRRPERRARSGGVLLLGALLSGCASFAADRGMTPVALHAESVLQKDVTVIRNDGDAAIAAAAVKRLSRKALTADSAVQIALLNNRGLQAAYNELATAEATMVGDSLPPNPTFSISRIAGAGSSELETQIALDILALATLPVRSEIAAQRFRQAQLRAIDETLRIAFETRRAYYRAVAAQELTALLVQAEQTAKTTAGLATKLGQTGSLNKLDQAREQVFYAETTADLASARLQANVAREQLTRLLGFWGSDLDFRTPNALLSLPSHPRSQPSIEVDAISHRVDLQIARIELETLARSYGLAQATRFLNMLDVAGVKKTTKEPELGTIREHGIDVQLQIPLFDFGEVRIRQAEANYMQAVNRLIEKAVNVRSEAREAYRTYRASYDIAAHYQREVLPLRKIISDESQLRFSAMQIDVFALLQETRQRLASLRAGIEAKRAFWLAQTNLKAVVVGGSNGGEASPSQPTTTASSVPAAGGH